MMAPEELDELEDERGEFDDIQVSGSDAEMDVVEEDPIQDMDEPEIAVEGDEEDESSEAKEDELEDDDQGSDGEGASSPPDAGPSLPTRLRIKLKLPAQGSGASSRVATANATPTPEGSSRRRYIQRDSDVESEDEDSDEDSMRSTSVATPGRPLTARQAVLRNVVDSSHVSLIEPPNPRKKKPLTEIEMALKREETARKRRNLSEKKLQDEKAETINRLLKKQSRSKGRRNALSTAEDRPVPAASVPGADVEDDLVEEGSATPIMPSMYRWISTTRIPGAGEGAEPKMVLSFSLPVSVVPAPSTPELSTAMDIDRTSEHPPAPPRGVQCCDVEGCQAQRKYRLVKDFHRGACGLTHLKHLETQLSSA